MDKWNVEC